MTLPHTASNFDGKCKKCQVKYDKGTTIYKIDEEYWCSDDKCPGHPPQETKLGNPGENSISLEAKLDQLWDICHGKSSKIIDETYNDQELPDKFERKKQKLIMAQSFIKALCGHGD